MGSKSSPLQRSSSLGLDLARIPLFERVSTSSVTRVLGLAHPMHVRTGGAFFNEGNCAEQFFVLTAGRVKLTQLTAEGNRILLQFIRPGDAFGGAGAFGEPVYSLTAEAVEPSSAFAWTSSAMQHVLQTEPLVGWNASRIVAGRLHELQRRYRQAITERVERRVARTLLRLSRDAGRAVDAGIEIDFAVSRQDIAEMTGTTLFTVSRLMSAWEHRGLVSGGRQRIVLLDLHGLAHIAADSSGDSSAASDPPTCLPGVTSR